MLTGRTGAVERPDRVRVVTKLLKDFLGLRAEFLGRQSNVRDLTIVLDRMAGLIAGPPARPDFPARGTA